MQENIPLTIERLSGEQEKECRIVTARQIQTLLRGMADSGALAALYYDGAQDFIMTSLLGVGDKGLWVEQGADMPKNRRIAESGKVTVVGSLEQVKLQFSVDGIRAVTHQGYPAFYLPLPASLYRIQRREYYRLMLPLSERLHCVIPVKPPQGEGQFEIDVMDISGGGVRLFYTDNEIEFVLGQVYKGCQINLPEVGKINVTLTVKNLVETSPKPGQIIRRVGCEFGGLDNSSSVLLQRYVTKVQRLRAAA